MIARRTFLSCFGGLLPGRRPLVLQAIAAERMPQTACLPDRPSFRHASVFELRTYANPAPDLAVLKRAGIEAIEYERTAHSITYLIVFPGLLARIQAWDAFHGAGFVTARVTRMSLWGRLP